MMNAVLILALIGGTLGGVGLCVMSEKNYLMGWGLIAVGAAFLYVANDMCLLGS